MTIEKMKELLGKDEKITVEQVMAEFDISRSTVFRDYAKIKKITGAVYDKNESLWKL
ncbi:DeoR-like helix-turn-helix domain-containing protein [Lachnospiraceae bacterium]|nr:DeoR-like helix-turn-helix domain-containing protein [Lachnospiraceae bacterium]